MRFLSSLQALHAQGGLQGTIALRLPISPALLQALTNHSWPGNLRELENTIKRYLVLGDEQAIIDELKTQAKATESGGRPTGKEEPAATGA